MSDEWFGEFITSPIGDAQITHWWGMYFNGRYEATNGAKLMGTFNGIEFSPEFKPDSLPLDFKTNGFLKMNPVTVALLGVFTRDGQLVGLSVDASDGRALMLPLVEIPRSARTLMGTGLTLGESLGGSMKGNTE